MKTIDLVMEFNKAFGCAVAYEPTTRDPERQAVMDELLYYATAAHELGVYLKKAAADNGGNLPLVRLQLIQEELAELAKGIAEGDARQILDALCDLQYVVDGAFITFGMAGMKDVAFREVHRSNMSKLGDDGKPILHPSGRVMKGPNYSPPQLDGFLMGVMACT